MNTTTKIGAAVVGGYVLGRRRKVKLAIGLGTWLIGKKLQLDPKRLVADLGRELAASPGWAALQDQVRGEVLGAGRSAAGTLLTQSAGRLADSLHSRTEAVRARAGGEQSEPDENSGADGSADEDTTEKTGGNRKSPSSSRSGRDRSQAGSPARGENTGKKRGTKSASARASGGARAKKETERG